MLIQVLLVATIFGLVMFLLVVARPFKRWPSLDRLAAKPMAGPWPRLIAATDRSYEVKIWWAGFNPRVIYRPIVWSGAVVLLLAVLTRQVWPILLSLVAGFLGLGFLNWRANRARRIFIQQLPDTLDALVQALKAGFTLHAALDLVARETVPPMRFVFDALRRAQDYQMDFSLAVELLEPQLNLLEWNLVAQTLRVQQTVGGNIIPVLADVTSTLRDKLRVDREVQAATASGRFSGLIIAALGPLSLVAFMVFSPSYINILTQSTLGHLLLVLAAFLEGLGFLVIWKLVTIDY